MLRGAQLEQIGDRCDLLGGPVYVVARLLLPNADLEPTAQWSRAVFGNGRHRLFGKEMIGSQDPWLFSESILQFDRWAQVGRVVAIVDHDTRERHQDPAAIFKAPVLGLARLCSVADGYTYEAQGFVLQRWQTLRMNRG